MRSPEWKARRTPAGTHAGGHGVCGVCVGELCLRVQDAGVCSGFEGVGIRGCNPHTQAAAAKVERPLSREDTADRRSADGARRPLQNSGPAWTTVTGGVRVAVQRLSPWSGRASNVSLYDPALYACAMLKPVLIVCQPPYPDCPCMLRNLPGVYETLQERQQSCCRPVARATSARSQWHIISCRQFQQLKQRHPCLRFRVGSRVSEAQVFVWPADAELHGRVLKRKTRTLDF